MLEDKSTKKLIIFQNKIRSKNYFSVSQGELLLLQAATTIICRNSSQHPDQAPLISAYALRIPLISENSTQFFLDFRCISQIFALHKKTVQREEYC